MKEIEGNLHEILNRNRSINLPQWVENEILITIQLILHAMD